MVKKAGLVVAFCTRHVAMARNLPRIDIRIHLVTGATKGRSLREFEENYTEDDKSDATEEEENFNPFLMGSCSSLRFVEEIDPEGFDKII